VDSLAKTTPAANPPAKLQMNRDGFVADIIHGRATSLFHYLVTRENSLEILCWGQENTLEAARHCINDYINHELVRKKTAS
jgi:hypothetical protein